MSSSNNGIDNLNMSTSSSYNNTSPLFRSQQTNPALANSIRFGGAGAAAAAAVGVADYHD